MSEATVTKLSPHYREFYRIAKNFNQIEQELVLRTIPTELLELELDRRHADSVNMIQFVYNVLGNAEEEDKLSTLDDLEQVVKLLRRTMKKGRPTMTAPTQVNNANERNGVSLILAHNLGESQDE